MKLALNRLSEAVLSMIFSVFPPSTNLINSGKILNGSGMSTRKKRVLEKYNKLNLSGSFDVLIQYGQEYAVEIETDINLHDCVATNIVDNSLYIYTYGVLRNTKGVKIIITVSDLEKLTVSGAINVTSHGNPFSKICQFSASGVPHIHFDIDLDELNVEFKGKCDVIFNGSLGTLNAKIGGATSLKALNLNIDHCTIVADGASECYLDAKELLEVETSGVARVFYLAKNKPLKKIIKSGLYTVDTI